MTSGSETSHSQPDTEFAPAPRYVALWEKLRRAIWGHPQTLAAVTSLLFASDFGAVPPVLGDEHGSARGVLTSEAAQEIVLGLARALSTVNLRPDATTSENAVGSLPAGAVVDVIGETRGQSVNGNDLWLLIRTPDGTPAYAWSGAFDYARFEEPGSPVASAPTPEQAGALPAAEDREEGATNAIRPEVLVNAVPDSALPAEILNAPVPDGGENSIVISLDGQFYRSVPFDAPDQPRYRWENGSWVDQHPGRNAYEYLINYHDPSRLFEMWGERIIGWNQEMLAYERDDGLFYYPLLGTGRAGGTDLSQDTDLLDGWVRRTETLTSDTLRLELTMAENHELFEGVIVNPNLNEEARRVLLAEIQRLYPNIRGTVIVQIVAEDVTRRSFSRIVPAPGGDIDALTGRIRDRVANGFNTIETPNGTVTFIRLSQSTTPSANPNDPLYRYGYNTLEGVFLTFDEMTSGRTRESADILGPRVMEPLTQRTLAANDTSLEFWKILVTIPKSD